MRKPKATIGLEIEYGPAHNEVNTLVYNLFDDDQMYSMLDKYKEYICQEQRTQHGGHIHLQVHGWDIGKQVRALSLYWIALSAAYPGRAIKGYSGIFPTGSYTINNKEEWRDEIESKLSSTHKDGGLGLHGYQGGEYTRLEWRVFPQFRSIEDTIARINFLRFIVNNPYPSKNFLTKLEGNKTFIDLSTDNNVGYTLKYMIGQLYNLFPTKITRYASREDVAQFNPINIESYNAYIRQPKKKEL